MKSYKILIFILIVFLKTGNVLSENNIFNVNNIELKNKGKTNNDSLANQAIKKGFEQLKDKILLEEDSKKLIDLKFSQIKELVTYYQVSNKTDDNSSVEKINYNISFDKDKVHDLFYRMSIPYSEIVDKELFLLPVLKKKNQIYIYNQNFFYSKWNEVFNVDLIEFILPLENIEIIQSVNKNKNNLINLNLSTLFTEFSGKNLALVLVEDNNDDKEKIYIKTEILGKSILKNISITKANLNKDQYYKKIITEVKKELVNLVKLHNLIDIRIPSFLNVKLNITKTSNLVVLNSKLKKIDIIENIYVQEFNKEFVFLKIKYLGELNNLIRLLESQKIILELINEQWSIKTI